MKVPLWVIVKYWIGEKLYNFGLLKSVSQWRDIKSGKWHCVFESNLNKEGGQDG